MIPVNSQIRVHDPDNDLIGDCFRACIASVLEMDWRDVPHFYDYPIEDGNGRGDAAAQKWLAKRGLGYVELPFSWSPDTPVATILSWVGHYTGDSHYILMGESQLSHGHVVVCHRDRVVHDPTYGIPHGIVGPVEGWYWIGLVTKL